MTAGEVVFSIANGYDADMWDDSLLIRQYERACESSRSGQFQVVQLNFSWDFPVLCDV